MVEPQLYPRAKLAISIAQQLPAAQKELVAGVLRAEAREAHRLAQVREDMDIVATAARTPYVPEAA